MSFVDSYGEEILRLYHSGESTISIAKKLDTYPNKIARALKKLGVKARDKSESQKLALESGRGKHPMKGKTHTQEVRDDISNKVHNSWERLTDEEKEERRKNSAERWNEMSEEEKKAFREAGHDAVRVASVEGSRMEKFVANHLTEAGYEVIIHKKAMIENTQLEIDLLVPELNVAIEIDGPSHFMPIWGEERLLQTQRADKEKMGLLLSIGYCIIRVQDLNSIASNRTMKIAGEKVLVELAKINKKFPSLGERIIEVEI